MWERDVLDVQAECPLSVNSHCTYMLALLMYIGFQNQFKLYSFE